MVFTVVTRCSSLDLVRLWCSGVVSACPYPTNRWVGLLPLYGESATKGGAQKGFPSHVGPGLREAPTPPPLKPQGTCTLSNCGGALWGRIQGRSPAFTGGCLRERLPASILPERP